MSENFAIAHKFTAKWEGGLTDHPADPGGITNYGVSLKFLGGLSGTQTGRDTLERMGIRLPVTADVIRALTPTHAAALFRWQFWDRLGLDMLPLRPAVLIYDAAVNTGREQAIKFAQRGYNRCVLHGIPLVVDGILGPVTRATLQQNATPTVIAEILNERERFYQALVKDKPKFEPFLRGWLNRADDLRRYVRGL